MSYGKKVKDYRFKSIWHGMKSRCSSNAEQAVRFYKEKGIKVCDEWLEFEKFEKDMYEDYKQHCVDFSIKQTTLDRIDGNKNYCKENCRWATWEELNKNKTKNVIKSN